ncbi:MAG: GTP-binding protein [Rhodobacterales bacterium]|nr:MAG: GTP-binding protein [Rhodobacterales bacterium]|tara:strand:- start:488 stop:1546 length:1059 start_codon:yes stop_codon:yes gene_type:complete
MNQINQIPVTVITGFLGSGKTTLLSSILKKKEMQKTAVIINEFGEIGLDHALIEHTDENIVELQSGCICCTIQGDLNKTLIDLFDKMMNGKVSSFNRILIETTGLANPVPIIHTLMSSIELIRIYSLDGVITVVDSINGEKTLDLHEESLKQLALAEKIILSKTDIVDKDEIKSLVYRIKEINPVSQIIFSKFGNIPLEEIFGLGAYDPYKKSADVKNWLAAEKYKDKKHHHHHDVNRHNENIRAFSMMSENPVNMIAFSFFRDMITAALGANLLRMKGIVNIAGEERPAVIHGVQHIFHPVQWLETWPDNDRRTKLVFITQNIKKEQIEDFFRPLMGLDTEKGLPKEIFEI